MLITMNTQINTSSPALWDDVFSSQEWGKYPSEAMIRFVARNFYKAPDRKKVALLEVGCGPGPNIWYMCREGFDVYGVDRSKVAMGLCGDRLRREGLS